MTLKELIDLFYEHGNSFCMIRLYFSDRMETYENEEMFSSMGNRLGMTVKTWKYELFNNNSHCLILDAYMREE